MSGEFVDYDWTCDRHGTRMRLDRRRQGYCRECRQEAGSKGGRACTALGGPGAGKRRTKRAAAVAAAVLTLLFASAPARAVTTTAVLVYVTDDLNTSLYEATPDLKALAAQGMAMRVVTPSPLCAPSRAAILTGNHETRNGIVSEPGTNAATWAALDLGHTVADWLHGAGWKTIGAGKGINAVSLASLSSVGWDSWTPSGSRVSADPYWLDVLTDAVVAQIEATPLSQPVFVYVAPQTPHLPHTPDPGYIGIFDLLPLPSSPAFGRGGASLTAEQLSDLLATFHLRAAMLHSVKLSWDRIWAALSAGGRAPYGIFLSDNGLSQGEGGRTSGKGLPYDEDSVVPGFVLGPDVPAGLRAPALIANHDVAPTVAHVAKVLDVLDSLDGKSLARFWRRPESGWRNRLLIEHHNGDGSLRFEGIRTPTRLSIVWTGAPPEAYDLAADPWQLTNLCATDPGCVDGVQAQAEALRACSGAGCWTLETAP